MEILGDRLIKVSTAAKLEDVSVATVWHRISNDPDYPKPQYSAEGLARLSEQAVLKYITQRYLHKQGSRGNTVRDLGAKKLSTYRDRGKAAA